MRRFATFAIAALLSVAYAGERAHAQYGGGPMGGHAGGDTGGPGGDQDSADAAKKKKRDEEWNQPTAPLPALRNAGPCPYVKVLYDAARYHEFAGGQETASAVGFTGEIQGVSAACEYKDDQPIKVQTKILFTLATWVLYAAALLLRRLRRWQGRQTALASLAGFGAILFSLMAVNFFFTDFHGFL